MTLILLTPKPNASYLTQRGLADLLLTQRGLADLPTQRGLADTSSIVETSSTGSVHLKITREPADTIG